MIQPHWKRLASVHAQEDGTIGAIWLAHDSDSDYIHVYDSCLFKREVFAVIAEGLNARGRWIPVAWNEKDKDLAEALKGCTMIRKPAVDSDTIAEVISRDMWSRMRTGRLTVDKRLGDWKAEFTSFERDKNQIPRSGFPLMSATRHAIERLRYARRNQTRKTQKNFTRLAIV